VFLVRLHHLVQAPVGHVQVYLFQETLLPAAANGHAATLVVVIFHPDVQVIHAHHVPPAVHRPLAVNQVVIVHNALREILDARIKPVAVVILRIPQLAVVHQPHGQPQGAALAVIGQGN